MGPKPLRATSRKVSNELPETLRTNFLAAAAQLYSTSLPQLSTHLGQQALLYAGAQQALIPSSSAKLQLCRKCGSPLNKYTCANVHIAWLSHTSSKRLSRKLLAHSSGQGSKSGKAGPSKLKNTVVAVRVCVACQEPSVRPFLSVGLAQKHLAAEGFPNVPVVGQDPKQQAAAHQQQKQQYKSSCSGNRQLHNSHTEQLGKTRAGLQHQQLQQDQEQEPSGQKRGAGTLVLSSAKRQSVSRQQLHSQQQQSPQAGGTLHLQLLQQLQTPEQQQDQQHCLPPGQQQQVDLLGGQQQQVIDRANQTVTAGCTQQIQQQPASSAVAAEAGSSMDQQKTAVATEAGPAAGGAGTAALVNLEKAEMPMLLPDQPSAVRDRDVQQQQPEACSPATAASTAAAQGAQNTAKPLAAAGSISDLGTADKPIAAQQQQPAGYVDTVPASVVTTEVPPTVAIATARTAMGDQAAAAAAVVLVDAGDADGALAAAAVVTAEQQGAPSVPTVPHQAGTSGLPHRSPTFEDAAGTTDARNTAVFPASTPAAAAAAASPVLGTPVQQRAEVVVSATVMSAPLVAGMNRLPELYTWHTPLQPAGTAAGTPLEVPAVQQIINTGPVQPAGAQADTWLGGPAPSAAVVAPAAAVEPALAGDVGTPAVIPPAASEAMPADSMDVDPVLGCTAEVPAAAAAVPVEDITAAAAPDAIHKANQQAAVQQSLAPPGVHPHQAAAAVEDVVCTLNTAAWAGEIPCDPDEPVPFTAAADMANTQDTSSAGEPAPQALLVAATPQPVAAAAAGAMREVFSSRAGRAAAESVAAQAWPVAPSMLGGTPWGVAAAEPGVLVVSDEAPVLDGLDAAAAAAGQDQDAVPPEAVNPIVKTAAQDAAATAHIAAHETTGTAPCSGDVLGPDAHDVDAYACKDYSAQLAPAVVSQAKPPVAAPSAPAETASADLAAAAAAAALQQATSSGIEADVSSEVDSQAAAGRADEYFLQTTIASAGKEFRSGDKTAAASLALVTTGPSSSDYGSGSHGGSKGVRGTDESDEHSDGGCGDDLPYAGPWLGGIRPAHAVTYESDSSPLSQSQFQSQSQAQSVSSSSQEAGGRSPSEGDRPQQQKKTKRRTGAQHAAPAAAPGSAAGALAAGPCVVVGGAGQHVGVDVDVDELFAGEGGAQDIMTDSVDGEGAAQGVEDEDMSQQEYSADSSEEGLKETEEQQQQQQQHIAAKDADMQEEHTGYGMDSGSCSRGLRRAQRQQALQVQQQGVKDTAAADVMNHPGEQQQQERKGRWRRQHQREGVSRMLLRHVCTRSHLLRKQVGRKAMRHLVYR